VNKGGAAVGNMSKAGGAAADNLSKGSSTLLVM